MDKQIHRDEFRLRILMTNACNESCYHCLNDFQDFKESKYIDMSFAETVISEYAEFCIDKFISPIISFSGGEPTAHKGFEYLVTHALFKTQSKIQINTNGRWAIPSSLYHKRVSWRFGVTKKDPVILEHLVPLKGMIQIVLSEKTINNIWELIFYYYEKASSIKIFIDFFNHTLLKARYIDMEEAAKADKLDKLQFRYTGVQENRGPGCDNCEKDCITLKAAWALPDNTITACPQKHRGYIYHPQNSEWGIEQSLFGCYLFHKV